MKRRNTLDSAILNGAESKTWKCQVCGKTEAGEKPPSGFIVGICSPDVFCSYACMKQTGRG